VLSTGPSARVDRLFPSSSIQGANPWTRYPRNGAARPHASVPMRLKQRTPGRPRAARPRVVLTERTLPTVDMLADLTGQAAATAQAEEVVQGWYARRGKRLLDVALLACVLPFASAIAFPVAACNLLVFRDPRLVFFRQRRIGLQGRVFWIYKFRTMREVQRHDQAWSIEADVLRTTRFGRILRNTHLDELPQLFNVLKGDMHLVGPRPEMVEVHRWACTHVAGFARRLATAPGLTGLAQITQGYTVREPAPYAEKLAIDLAYIARTSLLQDLRIMFATVPWVLRGRGWGWNRRQSKP
jgi:putative colanic acid biosynthesis UDP-glucose lipid carrier transferase